MWIHVHREFVCTESSRSAHVSWPWTFSKPKSAQGVLTFIHEADVHPLCVCTPTRTLFKFWMDVTQEGMECVCVRSLRSSFAFFVFFLRFLSVSFLLSLSFLPSPFAAPNHDSDLQPRLNSLPISSSASCHVHSVTFSIAEAQNHKRSLGFSCCPLRVYCSRFFFGDFYFSYRMCSLNNLSRIRSLLTDLYALNASRCSFDLWCFVLWAYILTRG